MDFGPSCELGGYRSAEPLVILDLIKLRTLQEDDAMAIGENERLWVQVHANCSHGIPLPSSSLTLSLAPSAGDAPYFSFGIASRSPTRLLKCWSPLPVMTLLHLLRYALPHSTL